MTNEVRENDQLLVDLTSAIIDAHTKVKGHTSISEATNYICFELDKEGYPAFATYINTLIGCMSTGGKR